jgi:sulfur carrier protein
MIHIHFNGTTITLEKTLFLDVFLSQYTQVSAHYAVTINKKFVPRLHHATHELKNNDCVDIITPMQGG